MARGTHARLNAQISEEAAAWFVELRAGDVSAASRAQFDAWVRSSPEHLRAYLEIAAIWKYSEALPASDAHLMENDGAALTNVVELPCAVLETVDGGADTRRKRLRRFSLAACLAGLLMLAGISAWFLLDRGQVYETGVGEHRSVRLRDSSIVELNSRSRISVRLLENERRVELREGQALFQVSRDRARPFVVHSGTTRVRAVGTQFDVNRKRSATVVTVLEGRVAVTSPVQPSGSSLLTAGEQVTLTPRAVTRPVRTNVAAVTAWTQSQLVLVEMRLQDVAEEFNRYSERSLIVEDHGRTELRLSGVFSTDPTFFISYLRERPDITVHETPSEIRIIRHD